MRVAFDSDVLIYAASPQNVLGQKVQSLLLDETLNGNRVGSALLLPELLIKPTKIQKAAELQALNAGLARLELVPISLAVATSAVTMGVTYGLKTPDALHLASAVNAGANTFLTNNRKDFKQARVLELQVLYPDDL